MSDDVRRGSALAGLILSLVLPAWSGCGSDASRVQPLAPEETSGGADIGPMTPAQTAADARILLDDLDVTTRISALADQAVYLLLDAVGTTRLASGWPRTTGRLTPAPGNHIPFVYYPGDGSSRELVLDRDVGPDIRLTIDAIDRGLAANWRVQSGVTFAEAEGRIAGRIVIPGQTDLRVTNIYRSQGSGYTLSYDRQIEGWMILPGAGYARIRARISGWGGSTFHGGSYADSVTAVVQLNGRQLFINERINRYDFAAPYGTSGNGSTQRGSRQVRIGGRSYRWPGIELVRNFTWNPYGLDWVAGASGWRSAGDIFSNAQLVGRLSFDAPVIEGERGGPATILTLVDSTILYPRPPSPSGYAAFPTFFGGGRVW